MQASTKKPTIFFSHSSSDHKPMVHLKDMFNEKTGHAFEVFLSCDGQSIPFGRNWVHKVEEALNDASLMLVFLTINSADSGWIYFEAGHAYSKGIRVVPIGFLGFDMKTLGAPLSLLQGFNVNDGDGLNNIIALANEEYHQRHAGSFVNADYQAIIDLSGLGPLTSLGKAAQFIDDVQVEPTLKGEPPRLTVDSWLAAIPSVLGQHSVQFVRDSQAFHCQGFCVRITTHSGGASIVLDSSIQAVGLSCMVAGAILEELAPDCEQRLAVTIVFDMDVDCVIGLHKVYGKLWGIGLLIAESKALRYKEVEFTVAKRVLGLRRRHNVVVNITTAAIPLLPVLIPELTDLLFDRGVLFLRGSEMS
ncbi:MAG: toll/interleukin-1 receptor domain-containing protein [Phycisphaerales bacterium]